MSSLATDSATFFAFLEEGSTRIDDHLHGLGVVLVGQGGGACGAVADDQAGA
jgi:hypothetical protein